MAILYSGQNNRNKLINANFDFWRWNTSQASGVNNYGSCDRWRHGVVGSTRTISQQSFTLGQTDVPGEPKYFCRCTITSGASAASDFTHTVQHIESVRTFAGETITATFYAKSDSILNMASEFVQHFGTGGTPSSPVTTLGVTTHALTTSWQQFTVTTILPSISGKTLGTNNDDSLRLFLWFDAGTTYDSRTNSLGSQTGSFDIAKFSLQKGTSDLETIERDVDEDLAACQRFMNKSYNTEIVPGSITSIGAITEYVTRNSASNSPGIRFPVTMRAAPTVSLYSPVSGNGSVVDGGGTDRTASALTPGQSGITGILITGSATSEQINWHYLADAELY